MAREPGMLIDPRPGDRVVCKSPDVPVMVSTPVLIRGQVYVIQEVAGTGPGAPLRLVEHPLRLYSQWRFRRAPEAAPAPLPEEPAPQVIAEPPAVSEAPYEQGPRPGEKVVCSFGAHTLQEGVTYTIREVQPSVGFGPPWVILEETPGRAWQLSRFIWPAQLKRDEA